MHFRARTLRKLLHRLRLIIYIGQYDKLTKEIIPRLIRKINELEAELQKKRREKLQLKTDKKILKKTIENLLKKLVLESTTDYLLEDSEKGEAVVPNNVPKTYLMKSDITLQENIKVSPQKFQPSVLYKAILEKTLVDNKIQPTIQIDINTQEKFTDSCSSILLKQDTEEKDKNPIKIMFPDDELLPSQQGRVLFIKNHKRTFDEEILPHYKVFVMDQQKTRRDDQQPQRDGTRSNNSNLSNQSEQSTRDVHETLLKLNSTTSNNQKSPSIIQRLSKKYRKPHKQSTVVKSDSSKSIQCQKPLPEIKLTEKNENKRAKIIRRQSKTQAAATSSHRSPKKYTSRTSQTKITGKHRLKTILPKASLIVLKLPEELDCYDEFIPPVAFKEFAKNANIIQIEELLEDETDDVKTEEVKQKLKKIGEALETGVTRWTVFS